MGIQMITPESATRAFLEERIRKIEGKVIETLFRVGEMCIIQARAKGKPGDWQDQTTNLRNSIGYVVVHDGRVVLDAKLDASESKELAYRLASGSKGFCLIVVAGMQYAKYVTARGYDVLDTAELLAEREVPRLLNELKI